MARRTILTNAEIDVRHGQKPAAGFAEAAAGGMVDLWTLIFADPDTAETIEITIGKGTRDVLVERLTGGIVLAGGELPNVRPQG